MSLKRTHSRVAHYEFHPLPIFDGPLAVNEYLNDENSEEKYGDHDPNLQCAEGFIQSGHRSMLQLGREGGGDEKT